MNCPHCISDRSLNPNYCVLQALLGHFVDMTWNTGGYLDVFNPWGNLLCINEPCCLESLLHFCKIKKKWVFLYFHEILIQSQFVYFKSPVSGLCGEGLVDQTLVNIWSWFWYWRTCFRCPRDDLSLSKQATEVKWALKPVLPVTESWSSITSFLSGIVTFCLLSVTGDCEQSSVRRKASIFILRRLSPLCQRPVSHTHLQDPRFCHQLHLWFWRLINSWLPPNPRHQVDASITGDLSINIVSMLCSLKCKL